ncbi:hypothetical protein INT47_012504 [Mucor saturninus]|uniref:Protein transport protein SEC31 n=1 Tax=Mucor saturninus TaxID=64648 RepID=A0A8H7UW63_9FUNG|nr:hypothetical protein INT47_012504 [Mucor saturninus]
MNATLAWSREREPMLVTGTLTGAMAPDFSSASQLEILSFGGGHLSSLCKVSTTSRFNTLAWGQGVIAGGMETNELELWNATTMLDSTKSATEALILRTSMHTGKLASLDFNFFQPNLLASAGNHSEVYIWDLNQPGTPFTPGTKSSKMDEITSVKWNCQVQHILSTASTNGYTVVWDLRNKKEVMTLPSSSSISSIAWNPDIATQIVTASGDDINPTLSLWDLRHAHSPEKTFRGHTQGILDVAWCRHDADLLVSSGKDGQTLCWNTQWGTLQSQVATDSKWSFRVDWCPRQPHLLAYANMNGSINVVSIEDSTIVAAPPPKWRRCPVGATFGLGGKLARFHKKCVRVTTIQTDPEIMKRSEQLESATEEDNVHHFIEDRIRESQGQDKVDWEILLPLFSENAREHLIAYLGFDRDTVVEAAEAILRKKTKPNPQESDHGQTTLFQTSSSLFVGGEGQKGVAASFFKAQDTSSQQPFKFFPTTSTTDLDGCITQAVVLGDFEIAVDLCIAHDRFADAFMFGMCGGSDLLARTQKAYLNKQSKHHAYLRLLEGIVQDDLTGIVRDADEKDWSSVLVILCTFAQSTDFGRLCGIMGDRLMRRTDLREHATLFYLAAGDLEKVASIWIAQLDGGEGVRLQELVEKITLFRKAIQFEDPHKRTKEKGGEYVLKSLYAKYCQYAEWMATQGKLEVAKKYICLIPDDYVKANLDSMVHARVFRMPEETMIIQTKRPVSSATTLGYYSAHQQPFVTKRQ